MNITKRMWLIRIIALIGLALSIELAVVYYHANFDKAALYSFCSINDYIDCDGVARSVYSQFAGIPLAWWGIFFYLFVLFMSVVDKINARWKTPFRVFKNPMEYLSVLGVISFVISMTLAGISLYKIEKICILCLATYFLDFAISLIATDFANGGFIKSIKTSVLDFIAGVKQYAVLFTVCLLCAVVFLTYTNITYVFTPHLKFARAINKFSKQKTNPYSITGNVLGDKNGKVKVILISDFVCPMCRVTNMMLHKAVKEYSGIYVEHYNFPLDKECNSDVAAQVHGGACMLSRIAIAAKKQGHYWDMASMLYDTKPIETKKIIDTAKKLKLDENRLWYDIISKETEKELQADIARCQKLDIEATPVMYVNGKKYVGLREYEDIAKILVENGAQKRS